MTMKMLSKAEINEARETLYRQGYVVIEHAVDARALGAFARHLDAEFERALGENRLFEGGGSIAGHLNCFPGRTARFIYEALEERGIVDVVQASTPNAVDQIRATTNYNLPNSRVQHYHTDGLYTDEFLICNVAVVDTDLTNGAIEVIPGSHKRFMKFWRYALGRQFRHGKRLCLNQGDALVRLSTTWHRGMPNHSDQARAMMSITFGEKSATADDPFEVNGGEVKFSPNWYGTDRLSQLREKAFVAMPQLYSSVRFARSLIGNKGYSSW